MGDCAVRQLGVAVVARGDHLGEAPQWRASDGRLIWIDMLAGLVHALAPGTGEVETLALPPPIGFAIPRAAGGLVVGAGLRILLVDPNGAQQTLVDLSTARPGERFNDAVCDDSGQLWVGTLSSTRTMGAAGLFTVTPEGECTQVLAGLTISNGMDWLDGDLLHIDSPTQRVDHYRRDPTDGTLGERTTFALIDPADGLPDGLTVDGEGGVWVALYGGGEVRRYRPDGSLDYRVPFPVTNVTCLVFGGPDLDELYVTSARYKLSDDDLALQPEAGSVFRVRPGVRGRLQRDFAG